MALPSFRIGQKELFLPKATLTLLRSTTLPPNLARFRVPLSFTKLDLRDYLFHAYAVRIHSVRSHVKQSRVQSGRASDPKPSRNRWHRPMARKYMTVELERPFVWPEEPEDLEPWSKKEFSAADEANEQFQEMRGQMGDVYVDKARRVSLKEQAKELLDGRVKWRGGSDAAAPGKVAVHKQ